MVPALAYLCERWTHAMKEDFFCAVVDIGIFFFVDVERKKKGKCFYGRLFSARRGSCLKAF